MLAQSLPILCVGCVEIVSLRVDHDRVDRQRDLAALIPQTEDVGQNAQREQQDPQASLPTTDRLH